MARKPAKIEILPESDLREGALHPRVSKNLFGHCKAEQEFVSAISSNRMPHAWLIQGPPGIGKATFAYRAAKYLLTEASHDKTSQSLETDQNDPSVRQIMAHSHPDLFILRREWNRDTKKLRQSIAVDDVRKATGFFHKTSATGNYRLVIVDCCDDLNRNGANALLKTLEEPPENGIFLLLSNAPGQLPATIHSRCRHLTLSGLGIDDFSKTLETCLDPQSNANLGASDIERLYKLSKGSPGLAIDLALGSGLEIQTEIERILSNFPRIEYARSHVLANRISRPGADPDYRLTLDLIRAWVQDRAKTDTANAAGWVQAWSKLNELVANALALNLDKRRTLLQIFNMLPEHCSPSRN